MSWLSLIGLNSNLTERDGFFYSACASTQISGLNLFRYGTLLNTKVLSGDYLRPPLHLLSQTVAPRKTLTDTPSADHAGLPGSALDSIGFGHQTRAEN
jgi:hypothetical protein